MAAARWRLTRCRFRFLPDTTGQRIGDTVGAVSGEPMHLDCFDCGSRIEGDGLAALADAFLVHARANHEWPFPDQAVRNYAEATQRLTGPSERLDTIGEVTVVPVTEERLDDWAAFFDHDAFVGKPEWAGCYCFEPHVFDPKAGPDPEGKHWTHNREAMLTLLRAGQAFGYLAYVDGRAAGWVNASKRSEYAMFGRGEGADPADGDVVGVSCFIIGPAYRRHGLAAQLLDRVLGDAADRGVAWIEAYPFNADDNEGAPSFRGPRSMYEARGFTEVVQRERDTVMRRAV
jgi:GNAT superfamily N-acetyltransferase